MHTDRPVPGAFLEDWRPVAAVAPLYRCRACGSGDVWYRQWESACGGHEDVNYHCRACNREWWIEGADA